MPDFAAFFSTKFATQHAGFFCVLFLCGKLLDFGEIAITGNGFVLSFAVMFVGN